MTRQIIVSRKKVATDYWNVYNDFLPDFYDGFQTYLGSLSTPPCTSGTRTIYNGHARYVPYSTIKMYRELINSNPHNQLASFGAIIGLDDDNAVPPWSEWQLMVSNMTEWDPALKCNARPEQPLQGKNDYMRSLDTVLPEDSPWIPDDDGVVHGS